VPFYISSEKLRLVSINKLLSALNPEELKELAAWYNSPKNASKQNSDAARVLKRTTKTREGSRKATTKNHNKRSDRFGGEAIERDAIGRFPASLHCSLEEERSTLLSDLHRAHWFCMRDIYCEAAILLLKCRETAISRGFHVELVLVDVFLQRIPIEQLNNCTASVENYRSSGDIKSAALQQAILELEHRLWKKFDIVHSVSPIDRQFIERLSIQGLESGYYIDVASAHFQTWVHIQQKSLDSAWSFANLGLSIISTNPDDYSESIKFRSMSLCGLVSFLKEDFVHAELLLNQAIGFKGCSYDMGNIQFVLFKLGCMQGKIDQINVGSMNSRFDNAVKLLAAQIAMRDRSFSEARRLLGSFSQNHDTQHIPIWYFLNLWLEYCMGDFDALPYRYDAFRKFAKRHQQTDHYAFRIAKKLSSTNWRTDEIDSSVIQAYRESVLSDLKGADLIPYLLLKASA
jgi:hypothetical protein